MTDMTPKFILIANDADITGKLIDRTVLVRVVDEKGFKTDTLEVDIDDRGLRIAHPQKGARLELYMGYIETSMVQMGIFIADEAGYHGPPHTISIKAKAADLLKGLKSPKTRTWNNTTIGGMLSTIAGDHGIEPHCDDDLAGIAVPHLDQTEESDLHILTRLADQYDAVTKPAYDRLHFLKSVQARFVSGDLLPKKVIIPAVELTSWDIRFTERNKYDAVVSYYYDTWKAERIPVRVGKDDGPAYTMRHNYRDATQARDAAEARLAALQRGTGTIDITLPGNPYVRAETIVDLQGLRDRVNGNWLITRAEHILDDKGYCMILQGEQPS